MTKKLFNIINLHPLSLIHYLPLTGFAFLSYHINKLLHIMDMIQTQPTLGWIIFISITYSTLLIGDSIIHSILELK